MKITYYEYNNYKIYHAHYTIDQYSHASVGTGHSSQLLKSANNSMT